MRHMLKALGFWIWGLIAIGIAVSVVPLGYRVATLWRLHDVSVPSNPSAPTGVVPTHGDSQARLETVAKTLRLRGYDVAGT